MTYQYNTYNGPCYYVNLNTYTKGKFGNTNFTPPLCEPLKKDVVSYVMPNYMSMSHPAKEVIFDQKFNTEEQPAFNSYPIMKDAYNAPDCSVCSNTCSPQPPK